MDYVEMGWWERVFFLRLRMEIRKNMCELGDGDERFFRAFCGRI